MIDQPPRNSVPEVRLPLEVETNSTTSQVVLLLPQMCRVANGHCVARALPIMRDVPRHDTATPREHQALPPALDNGRVPRATKNPLPAPHLCQASERVGQCPTGWIRLGSEDDHAHGYL